MGRSGNFLAGFFLLCGSPALADQLDGDWCSKGDGRILTIDGSGIVTAAGKSTTGDYRRHTFRYVDEDLGGEVFIQQYHDDLMVLSPPNGESEEWNRCDLKTS